MKRFLFLLGWVALLSPSVYAQQLYITPVSSTLPDVAGTGIQLLPIVQMAGDVNVYDPNRVHSRLHCVDGEWRPDQKPVWDAQATDDLASHLLSGKRKVVVFDFEPMADNELWRMVYLRILLRLQGRGLTVSHWGCDPDSPWDWFWAGLNNSGEVHPVWNQYTADFTKWEADRTRRLKQVRAAWPDRKVVAWLCWAHEPTVDGDPHSPLGGKYVGSDLWSKQLDWCRRMKVDKVNVFYGNVPASGPMGPFDEQAEGWLVYKAFARVVNAGH